MTDEEIKRNALKAEQEHGKFNYQYQGEAFDKGYLAGAHSRDEEIKELQIELMKQKEYIKDYKETLELLKNQLCIK